MIDTIRLEIKNIAPIVLQRIKLQLDSHLILENKSGVVLSEITRGSLRGSWDSRISVQVRDYEYVTMQTAHTKKVGILTVIDAHNSISRPVRVTVPEFLVVEFSLPKWFEGINFINSSMVEDLRRLHYFKIWFDALLGVMTPPLSDWILKRIDIAYCFDLKNYLHILRYVQTFRNLDFPRRKKPQFYQDSFFCAGSTTTIKGYAKETEFKAHDYRRLYQYTRDKDFADAVLEMTKGLFRFEVEFKSRKIESLSVIKIADLLNVNWGDEMKKEMYKLIKGGKSGKVFKYTEVLERLKSANIKGSGISVESCSAIWGTIVLEGDKYAKKQYGKMKVSRALKIFESLGITTLGLIKETKISPVLTEVNLISYDVQNGDDLRNKYNALIKKAA